MSEGKQSQELGAEACSEASSFCLAVCRCRVSTAIRYTSDTSQTTKSQLTSTNDVAKLNIQNWKNSQFLVRCFLIDISCRSRTSSWLVPVASCHYLINSHSFASHLPHPTVSFVDRQSRRIIQLWNMLQRPGNFGIHFQIQERVL